MMQTEVRTILTNIYKGYIIQDQIKANESMQSIAQELSENEHILVRNHNNTKSKILPSLTYHSLKTE